MAFSKVSIPATSKRVYPVFFFAPGKRAVRFDLLGPPVMNPTRGIIISTQNFFSYPVGLSQQEVDICPSSKFPPFSPPGR